ncbi:YqgQ family protein [Cytobacillus firmus]|uniref:YqgQ family protein n=1 Tax=Cytobacillus firmus TaxID=1399 RepID=UPI0022284AFC|nr:YqgQ family protein [Cytobacillus firmus]
MKTIYDIQQFLKKYGTIIYIGDREADLELMAAELKELYDSQLIDVKDYQSSILILRTEIQNLKERKNRQKR